jgi:hypothetical protein
VVPLLASRFAGAEPPLRDDGPAERPSYWVDFEAGTVEVDPEQLKLEQDVAIRVHRYRLTSDRLVLRRTPRGIMVDGQGRVAFCPCPDPPVTVGFSAATVAPPTDLLIENPTLRIGDVPILWLPYLWLRSPARLGVLPPRVAWRGDDGLLVGSGLHVPLGELDATGEADALDLYLSGYLQAGLELDARMTTDGTSTRVRFDHLRHSLLAADARGAQTSRSGAALAWRMDAIRGQRGRRGTISLEEASRRWDRAELVAQGVERDLSLALGARAIAERGGELDQPGRGGPFAHVGYGSSLGGVGRLDTWLAAESNDQRDDGSHSIGEQRVELALDARPGPLGVELSLLEGAQLDARSDRAGALAWLGGRARFGLPLVRELGARDPIVHRVEPFVRGSGRWTTTRGDLAVAEPLERANLLAASAGATTSLGRYGQRRALRAELEGGAAGPTERIMPAVSARAVADAAYGALGSGAEWTPDAERGIATSSRLRIGRVDALHLTASAEGRSGEQPTVADLFAGDFDARRAGRYDRTGWSLGGELGVPFASWLASALAADYDLSNEQLLGVRGTLGYRHPCGCLAALAWAGHRLGRDGLDAWLTVDLLP